MPDGRTVADLDQFWIDWEPVIRRVSRAKLRSSRVPRSLADVDDAVHAVYVRVREKWPTATLIDKDPGRFALGTALLHCRCPPHIGWLGCCRPSR